MNKKTAIILSAMAILLVLALFYDADSGITGLAVFKQNVLVDEEVLSGLESQQEVDVIIELKEGRDMQERDQSQKRVLSGSKLAAKNRYKTTNALSGKITKKALQELMNEPDVERIYFDEVLQIVLGESVPQINADDVWLINIGNETINGKGETVCMIDTGIDADHPFFTGRIISQHCFCSVVDLGNGGCCPNTFAEDVNAEDDHGHGTHTAGTAAGNGALKGVAPGAGIAAVKVCSSGGSCRESDIMAGIDWCTTNADVLNISAISISIGGGGPYNDYCNNVPLARPINAAAGKNITISVAAGNSGWTTGITNPACVQNATPVGAVNTADTIYYSRGRILELLAPGIQITSSYKGGGTATLSGTSMATPHVSGAVLLLQQFYRIYNNAVLTNDEIERVLRETGKTVYDSASSLNFSRIDLLAAVLSLDSKAPTVGFAEPTPQDNSFVKEGSVLINITAADELNEIASCILSLNNINYTMNLVNVNMTAVNMTSTGKYAECYADVLLENGTNYYTAYAADLRNNTGATETRQVSVGSAPVLGFIAEIIVNETELVEINASAADPDNETLAYFVNDTRFVLDMNNTNRFYWQTGFDDAGIYYFEIRVSDGNEADSQNFTVTVNDAGDFDNDGIPDFKDDDDDNDGIEDVLDKLKGDADTLNSNIGIKVFVDGSENISQAFNSSSAVNITDENGNSLIEFSWDFGAGELVLNFTISSALGEISVNGLDAEKTAYIIKTNSSYNYVCILDNENALTGSISENCNSDSEKKIKCPGLNESHECIDLGERFAVKGLVHSAVKNIFEAVGEGGNGSDGEGSNESNNGSSNESNNGDNGGQTPAPAPSTGGGGGGGGGGGVGSTIKNTVQREVPTVQPMQPAAEEPKKDIVMEIQTGENVQAPQTQQGEELSAITGKATKSLFADSKDLIAAAAAGIFLVLVSLLYFHVHQKERLKKRS